MKKQTFLQIFFALLFISFLSVGDLWTLALSSEFNLISTKISSAVKVEGDKEVRNPRHLLEEVGEESLLLEDSIQDEVRVKALEALVRRTRADKGGELTLTLEEAKMLIDLALLNKDVPLSLELFSLEDGMGESRLRVEKALRELFIFGFNMIMSDLSKSLPKGEPSFKDISPDFQEIFQHLLLIVDQGYSEAIEAFSFWYQENPDTLCFFLKRWMEEPKEEEGELRKALAEKLIGRIGIDELYLEVARNNSMHNALDASRKKFMSKDARRRMTVSSLWAQVNLILKMPHSEEKGAQLERRIRETVLMIIKNNKDLEVSEENDDFKLILESLDAVILLTTTFPLILKKLSHENLFFKEFLMSFLSNTLRREDGKEERYPKATAVLRMLEKEDEVITVDPPFSPTDEESLFNVFIPSPEERKESDEESLFNIFTRSPEEQRETDEESLSDILTRVKAIKTMSLNYPLVQDAIEKELLGYFNKVLIVYEHLQTQKATNVRKNDLNVAASLIKSLAELMSEINQKRGGENIPAYQRVVKKMMQKLSLMSFEVKDRVRLLRDISFLLPVVHFVEDLQEEKLVIESWLSAWDIALVSPRLACCGAKERSKVLTSKLAIPKRSANWIGRIPEKGVMKLLAKKLALFYKRGGETLEKRLKDQKENVPLVEKTPLLIPEKDVLYHGYYLKQGRDDTITTTMKPFVETTAGRFYQAAEDSAFFESQTIYLEDEKRESMYQEAINRFIHRLSVKIKALDPNRHPLQVNYLKKLIEAITSGEYHIHIVKYNRYAAHNTRMHIEHPIPGQPGRITIKEEALLREDDNDIDLFAFLWESSRIAEPELDYSDRFKKVSELVATMIIEKGEEITAGYARLAKVAHLLTGSEEDQPFVDIRKTVPAGTQDKLILTEVPNIEDIFNNLATGNPVKLSEQLRTFKHVVDTYA
jgi:hypothetical protein